MNGLKNKFIITLFLSSLCYSHSIFAADMPRTAQGHIADFQKGVDAFTVGQYKQANDYWLPLARTGDAMAARNMGLLFHKGLGVRQDTAEAVLFYEMAADAGVTSAQLTLGLMYLKGDEVARDLIKAKKYLTAASDAGNASASYNLGLMYEYGVGVDKNNEHAMQLYHQSARLGHTKAIAKVGGQVADPQNVPIAVQKAQHSDTLLEKQQKLPTPQEKPVLELSEKVDLYKQTEETGVPNAVSFQKPLQSDTPDFILKDSNKHAMSQAQTPMQKNPFDITTKDKMIETDNGQELFSLNENNSDRDIIDAERALQNKDYDTALRIYTGLYKNQNAEATYRLGTMYADGLGVQKSKLKTYYYWKKATEYGSAKANNALEDMRSNLSESELAQMERETL